MQAITANTLLQHNTVHGGIRSTLGTERPPSGLLVSAGAGPVGQQGGARSRGDTAPHSPGAAIHTVGPLSDLCQSGHVLRLRRRCVLKANINLGTGIDLAKGTNTAEVPLPAGEWQLA